MRKVLLVISAGLLTLVGCGHSQATTPQPLGFDQNVSHQLEVPTDRPPIHFSVLYNFKGGADGATPNGLVRDAAGNLYGTTQSGGSSACGCGVVFKVDANGNETILHTFNRTDGASPRAALIRDAAGNFYGTTYSGGSTNNGGLVFKLDPGGNETVLHEFNGQDGQYPDAPLIRDAAGNLYGTTLDGGSGPCGMRCGLVFKLDPGGNETVLHIFKGADGLSPTAGLVRDSAGNLYGTTNSGGALNIGVVFKLDPSGNETVLHNFQGPRTDGSYPQAGLVRDAAGNLYGTTFSGGKTIGGGAVFKVDPSGNETLLRSFTSGSGGSRPAAGLVRGTSGALYGTTTRNGATVHGGVVFKLDASGNEIVLHSFVITDGQEPMATLVRDEAGNLYGTTSRGGFYGKGVVFKLTH